MLTNGVTRKAWKVAGYRRTPRNDNIQGFALKQIEAGEGTKACISIHMDMGEHIHFIYYNLLKSTFCI